MTKKIIDMFASIAKPFEKGAGEKENIILDLLAEYSPVYYEGIGIVVMETKPLTKVIVSHIDLVPTFNKGFAVDNTHRIENDRLYGGLDNTITNATLILAILELRGSGKAEDVRFVFTEGEESGLTGISNYMKSTKNPSGPFYINLDVTNDNWGKNASIEFDHPNMEISLQIWDKVENAGFTTMRFTDDTSAILRYGGQALSYCIPTENYCHSYQSNCLLDTLEPYYRGLVCLIDELDVSQMEPNMPTPIGHEDFIAEMQIGKHELMKKLHEGKPRIFCATIAEEITED